VAMLAKEQGRDLHPQDGWDLSVELEGMRACVDWIRGEHTAKVGQLLQLVMEISNSLGDLGMLPIHDIPQFPMSALGGLMVVCPILEHPQEAQAFNDGL
jgi:hypothetical protein